MTIKALLNYQSGARERVVKKPVKEYEMSDGESQTDQWRKLASQPEIIPRKSETDPAPEPFVQPENILPEGLSQTDKWSKLAPYPDISTRKSQTNPIVKLIVQPTSEIQDGESRTDQCRELASQPETFFRESLTNPPPELVVQPDGESQTKTPAELTVQPETENDIVLVTEEGDRTELAPDPTSLPRKPLIKPVIEQKKKQIIEKTSLKLPGQQSIKSYFQYTKRQENVEEPDIPDSNDDIQD